MNIVILGPQASGKGTQGKLLAKKLKIGHISMGEIFRKLKNENTELGKLIGSYINSGNLVPTELTNKIIKQELEKDDYKKGVILDGFPRNIRQIEFLNKFFKTDYAIFINIPKKETIRRLSARRQCADCKKIFGYLDMEKIKDSKCPECSGELFQREDDKPEAIRKRLETYHKETEPLINFYEKKGILKRINGEQPIEKVFEDILAAIK